MNPIVHHDENAAAYLRVEGGGTVRVEGQLRLGINEPGDANVSLSDSTLEVGGTNGVVGGSGSYELALENSTLRVTGANFTTGVPLSVFGSNTIDTAGFDATFAGGLQYSGGFTKVGEGTLALSAVNTYTGGTTVNAGSVLAAQPNAFGTASLTINTGASVQAQPNLGGPLTVGVLRYGTSVRIDCDDLGTYHVNVPLDGRLASRHRNDDVQADPTTAAVYRPVGRIRLEGWDGGSTGGPIATQWNVSGWPTIW